MKITNLKTGISYQLAPGTQLEVERPNLFFNEWREQTLPVDIPDSDWNQKALGYPDITGMRKLPSDIQATISSGEYFSACRQAILKVKRKKTVSTSFYLNEGSFLSQTAKASVQEVFADETIPGVSTVQQGIDFCRSLLSNEHEHFTIFPVIVDFDNNKRYVNRMENMDASGNIIDRRVEGTFNFYNSFPRIEVVDDINVKLDPGYYMSPFIRAPYLLRRIFSFWGYTLLENFFDVTEPFRSMAFVNNTIDSLVNGDILLSHLVPDCMCSTILNVFRKRFMCEFIPDEVKKTVSIEFFSDIANMKAEVDFTNCLTSELEFDVSTYQKVSLSSESVISDEYDTFDSTSDLKAKYPNACYNPVTGCYCRVGYNENGSLVQVICSSNIPYLDGKNTLKEKKITCPDAMFAILPETKEILGYSPSVYTRTRVSIPYIGEGRSLNSTLIVSAASNNDDESDEIAASNKEQVPMLALVYHYRDGYNIGTNRNYTVENKRFADYSLLYNGPDGIYEKFYRTYDNLLRNSMHPVKGDILLSDHQKMNIPAHRKVIIEGQELFVDKLKYYIGGNNEPVESTFYTTRLYEPVEIAISESQRFPTLANAYCWSVDKKTYDITEDEYNAELVKLNYGARDSDHLPTIYPPFPTKEQVAEGKLYYERSFAYYQDHRTGPRTFHRVVAKLRPIKTPY